MKVYLDNGMPHTTKTYSKVMELVEQKDIAISKERAEFNWAKIKLQIIHPQNVLLRNTRSDLNSNSVVIRMVHGDNCFLFRRCKGATDQLVRQTSVIAMC